MEHGQRMQGSVGRAVSALVTVTSFVVFVVGSAGSQELPTGNGCVSVASYGATPNDGIDDTQGIQNALNATLARGYWSHCYLPPGTYDVSNTIGGTTGEWRFFTMRGAGADKTVIRLKSGSAGFNDPANPKPVFRFYYSSNATHSLFVEHLTIQVDSGNAGAVALRCPSHNGGGVTGVTLRAATNSGYIGLDLQDSPGPEYVKDLRVYGFYKGVYLAGGLYSVTMENTYLEGQRYYGIHNVGVPLQIRKLTSNNTVRAVSSGGAMLCVMDAQLLGGRAGVYGIVSEGPLFARNVSDSGSLYSDLAVDAFVNPYNYMAGPAVDEYVSLPVRMTFPSPSRSLGLPIKDVPEVPWDPPSSWKSVSSLGGFQAAVNSGTSTIYFPNNAAASGGDVHVNNSGIKRIMGFGRAYGGKVFFDNPDANSVVIADQVRFGGGVVVTTPGKVILKSFTSGFDNANLTVSGSGETYVEDYCCGTITVNGGKLWVRQLNTESSVPANNYRIVNNGGQLVVIGIKTEGPDGVLSNTNSARTDVLGGFVYPGDWYGMPTGPAFANDNSAIALFHNQQTWTYTAYIQEIRNGASQDVAHDFSSGGDRYVTNPDNIGSATDGRHLPQRGSANARMSGWSAIITTPAGSGHRVRIVDTKGRVVFARAGWGLREYRTGALRGGVYVVKVEAEEARFAETLVCRH